MQLILGYSPPEKRFEASSLLQGSSLLPRVGSWEQEFILFNGTFYVASQDLFPNAFTYKYLLSREQPLVKGVPETARTKSLSESVTGELRTSEALRQSEVKQEQNPKPL